MFPKGMFIDNIVEVAKKELAWEVDYIREAECTKKFKQLLAPYPEYYVPSVIGNILYVICSLYLNQKKKINRHDKKFKVQNKAT